MRNRRKLGACLGAVLALAACAGGGSSDGPPTSVEQAQRVLVQQGYVEVQNLHATGNGFEAQAKRDGRPVTVDIDGDGIIHTR
jgi:TPP-dependent pyruvate/acetoin dehydrogenase alpha subunit